jgi:membrane-associated protein
MDLLEVAAAPLAAYLLVCGVVALDALFPAVPSDAFVVAAGALAADGGMGFGWILVAVIAGAMAGDHIVFWLARHPLPSLLERSRVGRRIRRNVDRAYSRIENVGAITLAMARFIPFGRTAAAATAGLVGVPPRRYVWISLLGASLWAGWIVGIGYVLGGTMGGPAWVPVVVGVAVGFSVAAGLAGLQEAIIRRHSRRVPLSANVIASSGRDPSPASRP